MTEPSSVGIDDVLMNGFLDGFRSGSLAWHPCEPGTWERDGKVEDGKREGRGGSWAMKGDELVVAPDAKKDYWRRTFYEPSLIKDDGPCLVTSFEEADIATVETAFTLDAKSQFDQAGLFVRIDSSHWIKTGIEVVDGTARLSVVVTNVYSDWSTSEWELGTRTSLRLRVHKIGSSYVVEAARCASGATSVTEGRWSMVRICSLKKQVQHTANVDGAPGEEKHALEQALWDNGSSSAGKVRMGVFACCPEDQRGCTATFHYFRVTRGTKFHHTADGNRE
jgi:regulation of enolase protein 1 (concanavalin A-like superfamily)